MTVGEPPSLSMEQLGELLGLIEQADSVELKLSVPDASRRSTVSALRLDPLAAEIRQVVFFDTPDLQVNRRGVVVRARRVQGKGDDSVVKLRPVVPDQLARPVRHSPNLVVEVDAMPGGFVCSASCKAELASDRIWDVLTGERSVRKLFSKEQRAFYRAHGPEGVELDDLTVLGPIFVLKLKSRPRGFDRRLVTELWLYPDGSRILELSTKCLPDEAFQVAAEAKAFLAGHGVDLAADQQTKTRTALEFFSREHVAGGAS